MLHNNNNHKKALRHGRLCFILVLLFLGVKGVFCRITSRSWFFDICSINIFDSFFLAGVFIHIEMVHLHFDNVRICTKHTCEKYIKLQMNANYIFSHQKVPNVAFAYRHCTQNHRVLLKRKKCWWSISMSMCQKSEYFLYQTHKKLYLFILTCILGIWKWVTDYILIILSVPRFIHLQAIFRSKAGFCCSCGKEHVIFSHC